MKEAFEKIIERLEEELRLAEEDAERYVKGNSNHFKYAKARGYATAIANAIEIVNQVAEEEENDCCEWKNAGISDNWKPSCEPNSTYNVFGVAWFRRCPYCGKKIKVVE